MLLLRGPMPMVPLEDHLARGDLMPGFNTPKRPDQTGYDYNHHNDYYHDYDDHHYYYDHNHYYNNKKNYNQKNNHHKNYHNQNYNN